MTPEPIRIAMWSGPRNLSTAMMRSFGSRPDTSVIDEPFYSTYLAASGIDHPMRAEVLASQPQDWRAVVEVVLGAVPDGKPIFYQKHMIHHMLDGIGRDWIVKCRNAFLIRAPEDVLSSYAQKRETVRLEDIGATAQRELFERESDRLGHAPPVIDAADVRADPRRTLSALCRALEIPFSDAMLKWPAGRRATDGVWAPVWYTSVERSTDFCAPRESSGDGPSLPQTLQCLAEQARPHYERLAIYRL